MGGKKGKGHQRIHTKDPWTKPNGVGLRVGVGGGAGKSVGRKMETTVLEHHHE